MDAKAREKQIGRVSVVGIVANTLLGAIKVVIGVLTHSVAIITDAANNLSDTSSSIITIVGTRLAGHKPDMKHPFGFGRVEYLTSLVIGVIVFVTGIETCRDSITKIIHPHAVHMSLWALIILVVTVFVKIFLGKYFIHRGKALDSDALTASGMDARSDAVVTCAVLVSASLNYWKGITIDAYVGSVISLYIVWTGFLILKDTVSKMLGESVPRDFAAKIKAMVVADPMVHGAYDLILNNYGPNKYIGSVNVEVDHNLTAGEISRNLHKLQMKIYSQVHALVVFGIYAIDREAPQTAAVSKAIENFDKENPHVLGFHGLYIDAQNHEIYCDIVVDYKSDQPAILNSLTALLNQTLPGYTPIINFDTPYTQSETKPTTKASK